ncbi:unnamed protein product [Cuscuta europaea]|uniref:Uncharacterized protein n=1 Tax=Cuscuta europaea TaxID=41803 RepID=A0A9P0ZVA3_CUSEU|nr:unnamed protein product [Cuscuta europaea]
MDRRSVMNRAAAKAKEELAAKEAAAKAAASSDATKRPPPQPKKKRSAKETQRKLTEAGMQSAKRSKKASSFATADEAGVLTVPIVDEGGSSAAAALVDLGSGLTRGESQTLPLAEDSRPKRAGKEVEYPKDGGVFNDGVDGHTVLSQAIPAKDRVYLDKLGDVKIYDGGMDLVVQGAFMLMESHKR